MASQQPEPLPRFDLRHAPLDQGTVLLEASAGTGKTYTLTGLVLRLLLERKAEQLSQVLVVTFTVAATDELKIRIRRALGQALLACRGEPTTDPFLREIGQHGARGAQILGAALAGFDDLAVMTIHGFCKRVLEDAAFAMHQPFACEFVVDETPLWRDAAEDALRLLRAEDSPMLGAVMHHAALSPDTLVPIYRTWQRHPGTSLLPAVPDLATCLLRLRSTAQQAAGLFDDDAALAAAAVGWLSTKKPHADRPADWVARGAHHLRTEPAHAYDFLLHLSPEWSRDAMLKNGAPHGPFFEACDEFARAYDETLDHMRALLLRSMHERLQQAKAKERTLTFHDLLERTHTALQDRACRAGLLATLRERYRIGLIDEFQDTDSLQYEIFATVFHNRPLFLVGDPKQSIYGFRGADLETYQKARDEAVARSTLDVNWRSCRQLVAAVAHLFGHDGAFVDARIQMPAVDAAARVGDRMLAGDPGPVLRWRLVPDDGRLLPADDSGPRIAADVTAEIRRLLTCGATIDGRPLRPRDIAVLTRRNVQAVTVQEHLRQAGIVSAIGKAGDVFATDELVEVERLLQALLQPHDLGRVRALLATRLCGHDAQSLQALEADDGAMQAELQRLDDWRQVFVQRGFFVMQQRLLAELGTVDRLLRTAGGERALTNFRQLFEMLHDAEHEHRLSPEGLLRWLQHERSNQDDTDYERRELRLESDEDAVQILTMHGSKGLEYEVVFCPFLWDGRAAPKKNTVVGDHSERRFVFATEGMPAQWLDSERDRLAEDVRLAYVAITRAKLRCYVHWGRLGSYQVGYHKSAMSWLLERMPPATADPVRFQAWAERKESAASPLTGLRELVGASQGTMGIADAVPWPAASLVDAAVAAAPGPRPAAARVARTVPRRRRLAMHSFTSLAAGAPLDEGIREVHDPAAGEPDDQVASGIHGFRAGADAGQCWHDILEHLAWPDVHGDATRKLVRTTLQQYGLLAPTAHGPDVDPEGDVMAMLAATAAATVGPGGPTIGALARARAAAEWQFLIPANDTDLPVLAAWFARSGSEIAQAYAGRLRQLPSRTARGFLTGSADLVAELAGRYWLLDWKSNQLGASASAYGAAALRAAMLDHDYVLQYHLYAMALHRHLARTLPGYDYERNFGGVAYVFLRGVAAGTDRGVFHDRPPRDLLAAMERWLVEGRGRPA